jgi:glycosyltransferase involved in cell wall biosynthesis
MFSTYNDIEVPPELTRLNMLAPICNRLLSRHLSSPVFSFIGYETGRLFDYWVAGLAAKQRFDAVVAYENSALRTFEAAKKTGAKCILDAASLHHAEQDRHLLTKTRNSYKERTNAIKDKEAELADCIFVTSELAANSYIYNIKNKKDIKIIPLGVDTEHFTPGKVADNKAPDKTSEVFNFIFIGKGTVNKGFNDILSAINLLRSERVPCRLLVAGVIDRALREPLSELREHIVEYGMLSHHELLSVLRKAHCLVLPSYLDSFGMAVVEAMACGVPAIVSSMVGAKQFIEDGRNGFVVPSGDPGVLADKMRWCVANSETLQKMAPAARLAAESATWETYRRRFVTAVRDVVSDRY